MAQTLSKSVVWVGSMMPAAYSTAHAKGGGKLVLYSIVAGSSASSVGWALDLSADIKTKIQWVGGDFTSAGLSGGINRRVMYSSASGSASTGRVYAWSSTTTIVYSKNGQDLSGYKWRWLVLAGAA